MVTIDEPYSILHTSHISLRMHQRASEWVIEWMIEWMNEWVWGTNVNEILMSWPYVINLKLQVHWRQGVPIHMNIATLMEMDNAHGECSSVEIVCMHCFNTGHIECILKNTMQQQKSKFISKNWLEIEMLCIFIDIFI